MSRRLMLLCAGLVAWAVGLGSEPCESGPRRVAPYPVWASPAEARVTVLRPPAALLPGLLGHWRLDETSGLTAAPARGAYSLTSASATGWSWGTGRYGGGAVWAGGTSPLASSAIWSAMDGQSKFYVGVWMYLPTHASTVSVSARSGSGAAGGWYLGRYAGSWYAVMGCSPGILGGTYGSVAQTLTGWHHALMVFDGAGAGNAGRLRLYVDGSAATLTYNGSVAGTLCDAGAPPLRVGYDVGVQASSGTFDALYIGVGYVPTDGDRAAMMAGTAQ